MKAKGWDVIIIYHTYQLKMAKSKKWSGHGCTSWTVGAAPVPKRDNVDLLWETRSPAVRRFHSLKQSLGSNGKSDAFTKATDEYFEQTRAEPVPPQDMSKPYTVRYITCISLCTHCIKLPAPQCSHVRFWHISWIIYRCIVKWPLLVGPMVHTVLNNGCTDTIPSA